MFSNKNNTNHNFAVFILSNGRANHVSTLDALKKSGYTGKVFIVIDDEDVQADEYYNNFGDIIIQFHKQPVVDATDTMDLLNEHCAVVYARNEVFNIAKKLGITHFLMLDDDIKGFVFRFVENNFLYSENIKNFDAVCNSFCEFLDCFNFYSVGFYTDGDFIGGINNIKVKNKIIRKIYNVFFCKTDRPIKFSGTVFEDFCTSLIYNNIGKLLISVYNCKCIKSPTQSIPGGMTDFYNKTDDYVSYFYPILCCPSGTYMSTSKGLKTYILSNNCYPMIINEKFKKR